MLHSVLKPCMTDPELAQEGSKASTLGDLPSFRSPHPEFSVDDRVLSRLVSECHDLIEPEPKRKPLAAAWNWYLSWAIPGMGMFSEACGLSSTDVCSR